MFGTNENEFAHFYRMVDEGHALGALAEMERQYDGAPKAPLGRGLYALLHAEERGMIGQALTLIHEAIDEAPDKLDLHLFHARIHLKAGEKKAAIEAYRWGLEHLPDEPALLAALDKMGVRRRPVFASLPRSHPVNIFFGKVRARLMGPKP